MSSDLVERLREHADWANDQMRLGDQEALLLAAARIEALQAELAAEQERAGKVAEALEPFVAGVMSAENRARGKAALAAYGEAGE